MTSLSTAPASTWVDGSATITPAEQRVLAELGRGLSNKGIAAALVVSPRTVESHISNLLAKTGCQNRTQLLLWTLSARAGGG
ncbi:helix-turn-helix transcriptional regulator [Cyanobium sp. ATX 6A2]|uniref:response regulator transcription factor n=1 Tax=Cyanobium sp. ATX 6A2 TaxID=2823700 RepID=UPI0020CBB5AE|nr:helix-turn-helix transcriptional regulator [Cyanobium sp. ATX 6A2]MCP9888007.1 helix-turn-helix transcriptional regulator [Cyanobium sp. ATX 6A2]